MSVSLLFSFLGFGYLLLGSQEFHFYKNFDLKEADYFIVKGMNIIHGHRGNNFNGFFGVGLNNDSLYLPNHAFDNYKYENISIGDTLKVWNFGNKSDLLLNYSITKDKKIFLYSISKSLFAFLICNSLWIWFFIKRESNLPKP